MNLEKNETALTDFDAALKLQPDYLLAIRNRATALEKLGRDEEAAAAIARFEELEKAAEGGGDTPREDGNE